MLDRDLAVFYGVTTSNRNKAVKRNPDRSPVDFMLQLTLDGDQVVVGLRFQIGILKRGHNIKHLPYVFTREGVAMLSSVLRSPRAQHPLFVQRRVAATSSPKETASFTVRCLSTRLAGPSRKETARILILSPAISAYAATGL